MAKKNELRALEVRGDAAKLDLHVHHDDVVCVTNRRGYLTPENRDPAEIVVDATDGFVPLWNKNVTLRWQFDNVSMQYWRRPDQAKGVIRKLMGEALLAWGDASPVRFDEHDGLWDFRVEMRDTDRCNRAGCVLASAFFPDPGQNRLVLYPEFFKQSRKEQVETLVHEIGHIFGLRHFFANIKETRWASEIFGTHASFSIMNYGHESTLTDRDRSDLKRLYHLAWSGQVGDINGTPIRFIQPISASAQQDSAGTIATQLEPMVAATRTMSREELGRSLNLSENYIPRGRRNRPGTAISVKYITVHNTDNSDSGADAKAHSKFVRKDGTRVSWHYTVDDKCVIKQLPVREKAYHAKSTGNQQSIGIETCMHAEINQAAANDRLARLVAVLRYDMGLDRAAVVTHKHWTGKNCPRLLLSHWDDFLDKVDSYIDGMERTEAEPTDRLSNLEEIEIDHDAVAAQVNAIIAARG